MELSNELIEKLGNCKNLKEASKVMLENGINITEEELMKKFSELGQQELSDDDLNAVTGGTGIVDVVVKNLTQISREKMVEVIESIFSH